MFHWILGYELRASVRYGRALSLVFVDKGDSDLLYLTAKNVLRNCDEMIRFDDVTACVLMGETSQDGALAAVSRYREVSAEIGQLRFGLATFPQDGHDVSALVTTARRRLDRAKIGDKGSVVAED